MEAILEFTNDSSKAILVRLEPWASEYDLAPGERIRFVGAHDDGDPHYSVLWREDGVDVFYEGPGVCRGIVDGVEVL